MHIITGGIACGKSTVQSIIEQELDFKCLDSDEWYKDVFLGSHRQQELWFNLFGASSVDDVAFMHKNWTAYCDAVAFELNEYLSTEPCDVLFIGEYFKVKEFIPCCKIITVERDQNILHALHRDKKRNTELTNRIVEYQTNSSIRMDSSDFVIYNNAGIDALQKSVINVLKELT